MPPRKSDVSKSVSASVAPAAQEVPVASSVGGPSMPIPPATTTPADHKEPTPNVAKAPYANREGGGLVVQGITGPGAKGKGKEEDKDGVNVEDYNLPKSIVTRLAKGVLPPNTQIQGNAILAMQKSATVFVNYLASHANEHTQGANRKAMQPGDVFKALDDLEFGGFKERLEAELAKFNEIQAEKRTSYRKKAAADKGAKSGSSPGDTTNTQNGNSSKPSNRNDEQPAAKKARIEGGGDDTQADEDMGEDGEDTGFGNEGDDEGDGEGDEEDDEVEDEDEGGEGRDGGEDADETQGEDDDRDPEGEDEALDNGDVSD